MSTVSAPRILVVDDEPQIRRLLRVALKPHGFDIVDAENAAMAAKALARGRIDLILLDLGLPDGDGLDLLRRIRLNSAVPVVVLSVRDDEAGKVNALEHGADDYVTKPFGMAELLARIRTALRHRLQEQGATPMLRCGDLVIDLVEHRVSRAGQEIKLSKTEFDLLRLLATHAGKILTHQFLLREIWGPNCSGEVQYLRVYIRALRQKLGIDHGGGPELIRTETGIGYRLVVSEGAAEVA